MTLGKSAKPFPCAKLLVFALDLCALVLARRAALELTGFRGECVFESTALMSAMKPLLLNLFLNLFPVSSPQTGSPGRALSASIPGRGMDLPIPPYFLAACETRVRLMLTLSTELQSHLRESLKVAGIQVLTGIDINSILRKHLDCETASSLSERMKAGRDQE